MRLQHADPTTFPCCSARMGNAHLKSIMFTIESMVLVFGLSVFMVQSEAVWSVPFAMQFGVCPLAVCQAAKLA